MQEKINTAQDFLELRYGLTITDEKTLIEPSFLVKIMEEYASHKIEQANAMKAVSYFFTGRDYDDALAIVEAKALHGLGRTNDATKRLIQSGWSLGDAKKFIEKHFRE